MSKERCIPVEIGYGVRLDVLPDVKQIHFGECEDENVLYFTHVSQVITLIEALREIRESFINEIIINELK